jgi:chromosome partitioning protein
MQTLSIISQKGGAGKTTLAIHLAAEAAARGLRTLLIDLDPQASAIKWADRRGEREPDVSTEPAARLEQAVKKASAAGYRLVVIDTAPNADQAALQAARAADLVLIPCRPSILDLDAIGATLELCILANRPGWVVLNAAPIRSRVVEESAELIRGLGGTVCPIVVRERVAFRHGLLNGGTAQEYEPDGTATGEIRALLDEICKHPNMQTPKHGRVVA